MINLMTGEISDHPTGNNLWFSDDLICVECASGYAALHADKEVRAALADFLRRTYIHHLEGMDKNTDTDFVHDDIEYRFAVSESCPKEGPLYIYIISSSTHFIWLLDLEVILPLAAYLLTDCEEYY